MWERIKIVLRFMEGVIDVERRLMGVAFCAISIISLFDLPGDALGSFLLLLFSLYRIFVGKS